MPMRRAVSSRMCSDLAPCCSPETGIIDSHRYMLALRGDLEDHGGVVALNTPIEPYREGGRWLGGAFWRRRSAIDYGRRRRERGRPRRATLARATEGYPQERVPRLVLAKGNYFGYPGRPVFSRLVYPVPIHGGLGVHVMLDMAGRMRFGPDVEWIEQENYDVDPAAPSSVLRPHPRLLAGPAGQLHWCRTMPASGRS